MSKTIYVLSNNPDVNKSIYDVILVKGDFIDVLIEARNKVHLGYKLISHPLGASSRMMLSPYRSLLLSEGDGQICKLSLEVIENSIQQLTSITQLRKNDKRYAKDYAMIDKILLQEAIDEHTRLSASA